MKLKLFFLLLFISFIVNLNYSYSQKNKNSYSDVTDTIIPQKVKPDFIVNSNYEINGAEQLNPVIASDSSGNFVVAWVDYRNGNFDIYVQFYNSSMVSLGKNQLANESSIISGSNPSISMNNNGECLVVWGKRGSSVFYQKYKNGIKNGNNIAVNSDYGKNSDGVSIALNDEGFFMISWLNDNGTGIYDFKALLFSPEGGILSNGKYGDSISTSNVINTRYANSVAADKYGHFVFVRSVNYNYREILDYFIIDCKNPGNVTYGLIDDTTGFNFISDLNIVSTDEGKYFIAWRSQINTQGFTFKTQGRIIDAKTKDISPAFDLGDAQNLKLSYDRINCFSVCYTHESQLKIKRIRNDGLSISDADNVYLMHHPIYSEYGLISSPDSKYNFVYSGYVMNQEDPNIYVKKFVYDDDAQWPESRVNDDTLSAWQTKPIVCVNNQGKYLILWNDKSRAVTDLCAKIYDKDNTPVTRDFTINDGYYGWIKDISVCSLSDGCFIIGYIYVEYGRDGSVHLLKLSASGQALNEVVDCNPGYSGYSDYEFQKIIINSDGNDEISVVSYTKKEFNNRALIARFKSDLTQLGYPVVFFRQDDTYLNFMQLCFSINKNGKIFVAFSKTDQSMALSDGKIRGLIYNNRGIAVSDTFIIKQLNKGAKIELIDNHLTDELKPDYSVIWYADKTHHVLRKYDELTKEDLIYDKNRYNSINDPKILEFNREKLFLTYNNNFFTYGIFYDDNLNKSQIYNLHYFSSRAEYPNDEYSSYSCAFFKNNLIFAYESNQSKETGFDIRANIQKLDGVEFRSEYAFKQANKDQMYDAYPNPFNITTKIPFTIFAYHKVKLSVYDILGREVRVLVDKEMERGIYEVDFNAAGLPSGVYFCRLEAFNSSVKKILLLK